MCGISRAVLVAAALALGATQAGADEGAPPTAAPGFAFHGRLEWLSAASTTAYRDTAVNPANEVLRVPQASAQTELRPDLRIELGDELLRVVARPRLLLEGSRARTAGVWRAEETDASAEWLELYGSWRVSERLTVAYGLQNFQWGPAELLSPSNRIFHETGFTRDPLYAVRGKHLVRVNLSAGRAFSAVVLAEVRANDDAPLVAGEPFEPKAEAKLEWSAPGGRGYVGVTGGAGQRSRGFFGEYGALSLTDGLSVYADAVHQAGSRAWYPVLLPVPGAIVIDAPTIEMPAFRQSATRAGLRTLAVGGLRYTFADGADVRLEYLFDEAGWTEAQLALAARASQPDPTSASPEAAQAYAVAHYVSAGFELVGRQHAYASVSLPDLPPSKRLKLQARVLRALEDRSTAAFVTASLDATDSLVLFASAAATDGVRHGALSRLVRGTAVLGAVFSW
jgi:hypothetical protein